MENQKPRYILTDMAVIALILLVACVAHIAQANMYYFSHSPQSIPGEYGVYSYNSDSQELKTLSTGQESSLTAWSMVSGAATCGGRYYASAVDVPIARPLISCGLVTPNLRLDELWKRERYSAVSTLRRWQTLFVVSNVIGASSYEFSLSKMKSTPTTNSPWINSDFVPKRRALPMTLNSRCHRI